MKKIFKNNNLRLLVLHFNYSNMIGLYSTIDKLYHDRYYHQYLGGWRYERKN